MVKSKGGCAVWTIRRPVFYAGCLSMIASCTVTVGEENETERAFDTQSASDADSSEPVDTGLVNEAGNAYPGEKWPKAAPASHGFDADRLEDAAAIADAADTHCLTIVHDGYVIGEWYFDNWTDETEQNVFSVTKSFTSAVVGIASDMGFLGVSDPASLYITEWQDTASKEVTIAQLLSQTSGRYWELLNDNLGIASADDMTTFAIDLVQEAPPGTEWRYNNAAVQTLERVMTEATGDPLDAFAAEHLLSRIGMASAFSRDGAGNAIVYSDFTASCSDAARFGYLLLRKGRWGDEQIISEEYLDAALRPSSELNTAYGYLFWLNRDGHWVQVSTSSDNGKIEGAGKLYPKLPEDMVSAEGLQEQLIAVFPSEDLVIARIGGKGDALTAIFSGDTDNDAFTEELLYAIVSAKTGTSDQ